MHTVDRPGEFDAIQQVALAAPEIRKAADWYADSLRCDTQDMDDSSALLHFLNTRLASELPRQYTAWTGGDHSDRASRNAPSEHSSRIRSVFNGNEDGGEVRIVTITVQCAKTQLEKARNTERLRRGGYGNPS